jgi:hypothetical protein
MGYGKSTCHLTNIGQRRPPEIARPPVFSGGVSFAGLAPGPTGRRVPAARGLLTSHRGRGNRLGNGDVRGGLFCNEINCSSRRFASHQHHRVQPAPHCNVTGPCPCGVACAFDGGSGIRPRLGWPCQSTAPRLARAHPSKPPDRRAVFARWAQRRTAHVPERTHAAKVLVRFVCVVRVAQDHGRLGILDGQQVPVLDRPAVVRPASAPVSRTAALVAS